MSANSIQIALLRPVVLHILRAAGFHATRPAALDTLVDLTSRYIMLMAKAAAMHAHCNHKGPVPTITDVRLAMQDTSALITHFSPLEEHLRGQEDVQSVNAFIDWVKGDFNREIRRIAGLLPGEGEGIDIDVGEERGDFVTVLKRKYDKAGEESRFQGTMLGKPADQKPVKIEGTLTDTIKAWEKSTRCPSQASKNISVSVEPSSLPSDISSPLSEV